MLPLNTHTTPDFEIFERMQKANKMAGKKICQAKSKQKHSSNRIAQWSENEENVLQMIYEFIGKCIGNFNNAFEFVLILL